MLADVERHQSGVIAALIKSGNGYIAGRLARCQRERRYRVGRWPWRCRSAGCWQCRRTAILRWWRGFRIWLAVADVSLVVIPVTGDLIGFTRRLRKGLRDVRDRAARHDRRWAGVAMAGLVDRDRALVLIKHSSIDRDEVWSILERRWPEVILQDAGNIEPTWRMAIEDAALVARHRRGIEPLRIVILPQVAATPDPWAEPMPAVF